MPFEDLELSQRVGLHGQGKAPPSQPDLQSQLKRDGGLLRARHGVSRGRGRRREAATGAYKETKVTKGTEASVLSVL